MSDRTTNGARTLKVPPKGRTASMAADARASRSGEALPVPSSITAVKWPGRGAPAVSTRSAMA